MIKRILLVQILLFGLVQFNLYPQESKFQHYKSQAQQMFNKEDYESAKKYLIKAIEGWKETDGKDQLGYVYYNMGLIHTILKEPKKHWNI